MGQVDPDDRLGCRRLQEGGSKILRSGLLEEVGSQREEVFLDRAALARVAAGGDGGQLPQDQRSVLEGLALDQTRQQEIPLLPQTEFVVEIDLVVVGQEPAGLELDQRGRDQEKLGGDLEVELLHAIQLAEVRIDNLVQVDLVEIDLLAQDQVQQQIERTVEHRRVDLVRHRRDPRRRVRGRGVDPTIA